MNGVERNLRKAITQEQKDGPEGRPRGAAPEYESRASAQMKLIKMTDLSARAPPGDATEPLFQDPASAWKLGRLFTFLP